MIKLSDKKAGESVMLGFDVRNLMEYNEKPTTSNYLAERTHYQILCYPEVLLLMVELYHTELLMESSVILIS